MPLSKRAASNIKRSQATVSDNIVSSVYDNWQSMFEKKGMVFLQIKRCVKIQFAVFKTIGFSTIREVCEPLHDFPFSHMSSALGLEDNISWRRCQKLQSHPGLPHTEQECQESTDNLYSHVMCTCFKKSKQHCHTVLYIIVIQTNSMLHPEFF